MLIKCQNKSMAKKLYMTKCIAGVYQVGHAPLSLNAVCVPSVYLSPAFPDSFLWLCVLSPVSLILSLLGLCLSIFHTCCLWCREFQSPCSFWLSQGHTCHPWHGMCLFQPLSEGTEDKSRKRQRERLRRSFLSALWPVMLFCCCCFVQWEPGVAAETYRGPNGNSSCSLLFESYWPPKKWTWRILLGLVSF